MMKKRGKNNEQWWKIVENEETWWKIEGKTMKNDEKERKNNEQLWKIVEK